MLVVCAAALACACCCGSALDMSREEARDAGCEPTLMSTSLMPAPQVPQGHHAAHAGWTSEITYILSSLFTGTGKMAAGFGQARLCCTSPMLCP